MIKRKETLLPLVLLASGVLCMCVGAYRGEVKTMFEKAINICLECIGIG